MRSHVCKIAGLIALAYLLSMLPGKVHALNTVPDNHQYNTDAYDHCMEASQACIADLTNPQNYTAECQTTTCTGGGTNKCFAAVAERNWVPGSYEQCTGSHGDPLKKFHIWTEVEPQCPEAGTEWAYLLWYDEGQSEICLPPGCALSQVAGVQNCLPDGSCIGRWAFTGSNCTQGSGNEPNEEPEGCVWQNNSITCDCNENPTSSICNIDDTQEPNCTTNPDGSVTCIPVNDPDPPNDEGPPGNDQQPGNGDGEGEEDEGGCTGSGCDDENQLGSSSDTCDVPPTCTGQAIQCAMLKQQWKSICWLGDVKDNPPPWDDDPDWGRDLKAEAELVNVGAEIQAGSPSGTCPENPSFTVFGETIEIDISMACSLAGIIRVFVLLGAWLTAGFIVARSF